MIDAFNSTSRYMDDPLNINNIHYCRDIPDNGLDNKNNTKLRYKFHKFFLSKVPAQCKTIISSENDRDMATLLETP